jgi:hypothetical protein
MQQFNTVITIYELLLNYLKAKHGQRSVQLLIFINKNKRLSMKIIIVTVCLLSCFIHLQATKIKLSAQEIEQVGKKIWQNECSLSTEKLTWWNDKEDCASLGIGHFIWYPKEHTTLFTEQFPELMRFLKNHRVKVPAWLMSECPWNSREEFFDDFNSKRMLELRELLLNTINLQVKFILKKTEQLINSITKSSAKRQFDRLIATREGIYAVIDYTHFKGPGLNLKEQYNNEGWGLLQVLETMQSSNSALEDFIQSAEIVLKRRVQNAPAEKKEDRWLKGWLNRVANYRLPFSSKIK